MTGFDTLVTRLTARAAAIANAQAERHRQPDWWRQARLLWPLFTKG